ncbi:hypothetical protein ACI2IX_20040 [Leifsonia aquatica]|uniref:hypothetical protein n=1 Tax=Leifsonia aquatica TaxID=144185 RepID=UPI0038512D4E
MNRTEEEPFGPPTLSEWHIQLEERLREHDVDIDHLQGDVNGLGSQLVKLLDWLDARPGGPWSWRTLDQKAARELWAELYEWVNWLRDRYLVNLTDETNRLINDWYKHPVAVELLTALMVSHQSVYRRTKSAPSFDLVEWHERCLWPTFERMKTLNLFPKNMRAADPWTPEARIQRVPDEGNFASFVIDDIAARPKPKTPPAGKPATDAEPRTRELIVADEQPPFDDADVPPPEEDREP